jgi:alkanesulfonate monooxygenase SsuD/methylene tetrahydromethanopterin reductase-like flavin-dependent oxidoreductase (luciferase family)
LFGGPSAEGEHSGTEHAYHRFGDYAVEAESLGFASVFLTEHHFTGLGQAGVEYVLLIDRDNSPETLRAFAREVMPRLSGAAVAG